MHADQNDPVRRERSINNAVLDKAKEMRCGAWREGLAFVRSRDSRPSGREGRVQ